MGLELLTEEKACKMLGIKKGTMKKWRSAGKGPTFIKLGRVIRYERNKLTDYIKERKVETKG